MRSDLSPSWTVRRRRAVEPEHKEPYAFDRTMLELRERLLRQDMIVDLGPADSATREPVEGERVEYSAERLRMAAWR